MPTEHSRSKTKTSTTKQEPQGNSSQPKSRKAVNGILIALAALAVVTVALIIFKQQSAQMMGVGSSTMSPSPSLDPTPVLTETPAPSPSDTPSPSPTATPTPQPTPTPTADPWAGKFDADGPYVSVLDPINGPWVYKDQTLSITITLQRGGPQNRRYYKADIYTRGPLFYGGFAFQNDNERKTELPYKIARRYDAIFAITADYISKKTNPKGIMMRQDKVYYDSPKDQTLAIMPDTNLNVYEAGETTAAKLQSLGVKDSFTFGPIMVKDGKIQHEVYTHFVHASNYRAAIGQVEKGHYICITTLGGFPMKDLAQLFVDNKCTIAYNMDGGHSACMIFMGEQLNHQFAGMTDGVRQRPLPDLMMLGYSASIPDPKAPVYCDGVNLHPKYKPKPTQGPIG